MLTATPKIPGSMVLLPLNVVSSASFTPPDLLALLATQFVGDHMEGAPRQLLTVTARYTALFVTLLHIGEVIQPPKNA
jgi:hypothetical protein